MVVKQPCGICLKAVAKIHSATQCDLCDKWIHIKCNGIDKLTYEKVKTLNTSYCLNCTKTFLSFSNISYLELSTTPAGKSLKFNLVKNLTDNANLKNLFGDLNNLSYTSINCKYVDVPRYNDYSQSSLSFLHINISSLPYHIDDLKILLASLDNLSDIIGITESDLHDKDVSTANVDLD